MIAKGHIPIRNIYWMLAYAVRAVDCTKILQPADAEACDKAHDLLALFLQRGIADAVRRGLHKGYEIEKDELWTVRGRIDIEKTILLKCRRCQRISCEFDEFTDDTLFNRILKTAALFLLRSQEVSEERKIALKRSVLLLNGVADISPSSIKWETMRFDRGKLHYRPLMLFCRLVFSNLIMDDSGDGKGRLWKADFDKVLSSIFEEFLREYFRYHYRLGSDSSRIDWALDGQNDTSYLPSMKTDVTLEHGGKTFIIDAKFYGKILSSWHGAEKANSGLLYQIFAYVQNTKLKFPERKVGGMLLFARTDEPRTPAGNWSLVNGTTIAIDTLDLDCEFCEIAAKLDEIITREFSGVEKATP